MTFRTEVRQNDELIDIVEREAGSARAQLRYIRRMLLTNPDRKGTVHVLTTTIPDGQEVYRKFMQL